MINFFRKIRQNSLMENKTGKYFKYAIGEIVLVVIGILIALQINNWNEKRKEHNLSEEYSFRIVEDLDRLIERSTFRSHQNREILMAITDMQHLLNRGTALTDSEKETVDYAMLWFPRTTYQVPNMLTYEEMKESGKLGLINDVLLRNELAEFYSFLLQVESIYEKLGNDIEDQFNIYNRYIEAKTDPENLSIKFLYDFNAMANDKEFVNTFSRLAVHWRGFVFFNEAVNSDGIKLKEKMTSKND
jgi:hypothetical protein